MPATVNLLQRQGYEDLEGRVEAHEPGKPMRTVLPGSYLTAPGVLKNPVLVEALYDRNHAEQATLVNLLQRQGYEDLEAVLAKGHGQGLEEGMEKGLEKGLEKGILMARSALRRIFARRRLALGTEQGARIDACTDLATLERWIEEATVAESAADALQ